jgi:hypothetical protein
MASRSGLLLQAARDWRLFCASILVWASEEDRSADWKGRARRVVLLGAMLQ